MDHGIDSRVDGDFLRNGSGESSIKDGPVRQHTGGNNSSLDGLTSLDYSDLSYFRSGSSGSGNLNERNSSTLSDSNSINIVKLSAVVFFLSQISDNLGNIHGRASTEANNSVNTVLNAHVGSIIDVLLKRVRNDSIEDHSLDSSSLERSKSVLKKSSLSDTSISYDADAFASLFNHDFSKLLGSAKLEKNVFGSLEEH